MRRDKWFNLRQRFVIGATAYAVMWVLGGSSSLVVARPADGSFANSSLRVGIVGDQHGVSEGVDPYPTLASGLALLKQKNAQVILHVGDLIEGIGQTPTEYGTRFNRAAGILDQVRIPWYLTPGDHDINPKEFTPNSADDSIKRLFYSNYHPRRPELMPNLYYSFDVEGYHFIALNSLEHLRTDVRWGDVFLSRITEEQFAWLQGDLAKHKSSAGIVVFMHQPLWYNVAAWQPVHRLLRQYPVRAVIAGHTHYSQDEGQLDGIRYLIVGATGAAVKQGSPESGSAQVVALLSLTRAKIDLELLPIGTASPRTFASRLDMDRVQAMDTVLADLSDWQWESDDAVCIQNGMLVMKKDKSPAAVRLRAIGNPIDIPARLEIQVDAAGLPLTNGKFSAGVCEEFAGQQCVIAAGTNVTISNVSAVEFRWPPLTEAPSDQQVPSLPVRWEAPLATGGSVKPGTTLHVKVKYSFESESGVKSVERDLHTVVNDCGEASPTTSRREDHSTFPLAAPAF